MTFVAGSLTLTATDSNNATGSETGITVYATPNFLATDSTGTQQIQLTTYVNPYGSSGIDDLNAGDAVVAVAGDELNRELYALALNTPTHGCHPALRSPRGQYGLRRDGH